VQRVIAQIPWRSNIALLDKLEKPEERLWYGMKTIKHAIYFYFLLLTSSRLKKKYLFEK